MKNCISVVIGCFIVLCFMGTGCKETADVTMDQIHKLEDTITKIIPMVSAINIKVVKQTELEVIICNVHFYSENAEKLQSAAIRSGEIAMFLFGEENSIKSGKLYITKVHTDKAWDTPPADAIAVDMKIDSLREHDEHLLEFFSRLHK